MSTPDDKATKVPGTTPDAEVDADADVEGHSMFNPMVGRELARAREADIQRTLRARQVENEAKRPYKK